MAEPFIGEIHIYPYNFAPRGWADCNGQQMSIAQQQALFAVIGAQFGGDGQTNFNLPNLMSRSPMHWGQGNGLTNRPFASTGGDSSVALSTAQMPNHNHTLTLEKEVSDVSAPAGSYPGQFRQGAAPVSLYDTNGSTVMTTMNFNALSPAGLGTAHNNMQPYMVLRFCIALEGMFPVRN